MISVSERQGRPRPLSRQSTLGPPQARDRWSQAELPPELRGGASYELGRPSRYQGMQDPESSRPSGSGVQRLGVGCSHTEPKRLEGKPNAFASIVGSEGAGGDPTISWSSPSGFCRETAQVAAQPVWDIPGANARR